MNYTDQAAQHTGAGHFEIYPVRKPGNPLMVPCSCSIDRDHDYADWLKSLTSLDRAI